MSTAEEYKEAGNKAFSAKNYDEAIKCYTNAIKEDKTNHVFYSNRSASYAGKRKWDEAVSDAKECIKLNPSFIKGYYRLATAQIEQNELDSASASIKQGLNIDPDNTQLHKLMRSIKLKKQMIKAEKQSGAARVAAAAAASSTGGVTTTGGAADSSLAKEIMDLQTQLKATVRDYSYVNGDIIKAQKSQRVNEITIRELDTLPKDSDPKMYMGVGKMFVATTSEDVHKTLEQENKDFEKKATEMTQRKEYLERRMKSQQQNIIELTSNA
jgi:tetratricopeptide (TPR) repeat protein